MKSGQSNEPGHSGSRPISSKDQEQEFPEINLTDEVDPTVAGLLTATTKKKTPLAKIQDLARRSLAHASRRRTAKQMLFLRTKDVPPVPDSESDSESSDTAGFEVGDTVMYPSYYNGRIPGEETHSRVPYFFWAKAVVGQKMKDENGTVIVEFLDVEFIPGEKLKVKEKHIKVISEMNADDSEKRVHLKPEELTKYLGMFGGDANGHFWRYNDKLVGRDNEEGHEWEYVKPYYNYLKGDFNLWIKETLKEPRWVKAVVVNGQKKEIPVNLTGKACLKFLDSNRRYFPAGCVPALEPKGGYGIRSAMTAVSKSKKELKNSRKQKKKDNKLSIPTKYGRAIPLEATPQTQAISFRRLAEINGPSTTFTVGCILAAGLIGYFTRRFFCKRRPTERKDDEHCL